MSTIAECARGAPWLCGPKLWAGPLATGILIGRDSRENSYVAALPHSPRRGFRTGPRHAAIQSVSVLQSKSVISFVGGKCPPNVT
jgi:hypothetical protein